MEIRGRKRNAEQKSHFLVTFRMWFYPLLLAYTAIRNKISLSNFKDVKIGRRNFDAAVNTRTAQRVDFCGFQCELHLAFTLYASSIALCR